MIDTYLRTPYQKRLIEPLFKLVATNRLNPNLITAAGLLMGISVIPALIFDQKSLAIVLLLLSGYFDTLDGTLARLHARATNKGAVLDIVSDRIVEFSVVLGLFLVAPEERALLCMLMLGSILVCVTSFLVVGVFTENSSEKSFHYSPGLMERSEAFIFFGLMILIPSMFAVLAIAFIMLVSATAVYRVWEFAKER